MHRISGISTGPETHLDHLAPICALMKMPLLVADKEQALLCQTFYPSVEVHHTPLAELTLSFLATEFDAIFHCGKLWALELKPLLNFFCKTPPRFVLCPHGNSDKEAITNEPITQDITLVYGEQMRALHKGPVIETGNLRHAYYLNHRSHLDGLAQDLVFSHMNLNKKIILYAPTWQTKESPSSFFDSTEKIINALAETYNVLIKLHPLLPETHPAQYWRIVEKYKEAPGVQFLTNFPAIYPLLEKADAYIGDYSSIGYDFLLYDRPMFFIYSGTRVPLHSCGRIGEINELKEWEKFSQKEFSNLRGKTYAHAFCMSVSSNEVYDRINNSLRS